MLIFSLFDQFRRAVICAVPSEYLIGKHLVLVTGAVPFSMDMIGETTSDVGTVVGNRPRQGSISMRSRSDPTDRRQPAVKFHPSQEFDQPCHDFSPKLTRAVAPSYSPSSVLKCVNHTRSNTSPLFQMQLLKSAHNFLR